MPRKPFQTGRLVAVVCDRILTPIRHHRLETVFSQYGSKTVSIGNAGGSVACPCSGRRWTERRGGDDLSVEAKVRDLVEHAPSPQDTR